ncbi:MAG: ATP-binding protein [Thermodesulfobacteriota bacterium]|nr:ATP-binding protein [Thermodesulfobacteriota bacterium]
MNDLEPIGQTIQRCQELNQRNTQDWKQKSKPNSESIPDFKKTMRFQHAKKEDIDPQIWENIKEIFENEELGLYIYGKVGTGKTHFLHIVKKEIQKIFPTKSTQIISTPDLFLRIKSTFSEIKTEKEEDIIKELSGSYMPYDRSIKILLLDDLGIEKPSEWAIQTLYSIIDKRYQKCLKTFFTSNLSLDELSEKLGDRIPSRIAEMCKIIELTGKDRRIK